MLSNAYLLAKIGADTAENEQRFAEILPTDALWRRRRRPRDVDALAADLEHAIAAPAAEASKMPPDPLTLLLQKRFDLVIWMDKVRRFAESFL